MLTIVREFGATEINMPNRGKNRAAFEQYLSAVPTPGGKKRARSVVICYYNGTWDATVEIVDSEGNEIITGKLDVLPETVRKILAGFSQLTSGIAQWNCLELTYFKSGSAKICIYA